MSAGDATPLRDGDLIAAIDLGSNSYQMVVARLEHGEPRVIDRLRDPVRMAAGLQENGALEAGYHDRAMQCLARFGQRLAGVPSANKRAVATNSVRRLASPQAFLRDAEAALGHPVEVVSGREEGRLIFLGAAHDLPASREPRLVIDVGGGSTEFIIGRSLTPLHTESVQVGCIATTQRFFPGGRLTRKRWQQARGEIRLLLQQFEQDYREAGWQSAYGSAGTAKAIGSIVQAMKLSEDGITPDALASVREALLTQGHVNALKLPGLTEDRAPVIAGGVVIFEAAFAALGIQRMRVCESSMREGVLWDLLGRAGGSDPRTDSVDALARRHGVDRAQARRVESTALLLFEHLAHSGKLEPEAREWLAWAARVHEIGLAVAHSQHHHHGAYILRHADLAGFSRQEQQLLAAVVELHRRKPHRKVINALPQRHRLLARQVTALLRLAVLLRRARRAESLPTMHLTASRQCLQLALPAAWLSRHPLTAADLEQEKGYLKELGFTLELSAV